MSVLQKLTEGVQSRDMQAEGAALLNKWEATGLLEGLNEGSHKQGMAMLLENQAKELLREASAMGSGDVEGFAAVAFPIVRRVFGGLIANDLVSVQPMSLPSGLIFFLDFIKSPDQRGGDSSSIYGGNKVAKEIQTGVDLAPTKTLDAGGFYDFNTGFSHATASALATAVNVAVVSGYAIAGDELMSTIKASEARRKEVRYDADLLAVDGARHILALDIPLGELPELNRDALSAITIADGAVTDDGGTERTLIAKAHQVKRLTQLSDPAATGADTHVRVFLLSEDGTDITHNGGQVFAANDGIALSFPKADHLDAVSGGVGAVNLVGTDGSGIPLENAADMAEIDIKVDSIAVTAQTKKLKAKWSPELGQDLNAYHNLDAEVELTGILSEQIALEIDRELLGELVSGAKAGTRYWSRAPGLFLDSSGSELGAASAAPDFTGTVSEWYETLIETINDVSAQIHRKTLRGGANFVVCSPEVANILEFTSGFRASVTADQDRGTIGAVKAGSLSKKFDVYVDPYFLRNVLLVGRKGSSFLESGFVYAPYVPLQVTPTIFGTEDFVPRKGVMTRYAKQMVRPDMYGLVVVRGLLGESGR